MSTSSLPRKPVESWEAVRDQWVADVEQFMDQTEIWANEQDWATLRDPKTIDEDRIGEYTVPRMLVHTIFGRFIFDPIAHYVAGATGLIDLLVMPSYDRDMIVRGSDGLWYFHVEHGATYELKAWTKAYFVETINRLGGRI